MSDLRGQRVVVTRAAHQASELSIPLQELGAQVILLPMIGIAPPGDIRPLRSAAEHVNDFDWLIFTSTNAVDSFTRELSIPPEDIRPTIAVIGPATAERARSFGFRIALVPESSVSESLAEAIGEGNLQDKRVLLPTAAVTRDVLPSQLSSFGARVHVVEAYRNAMPEEAVQRALTVFVEPLPEWVTFASPSAAKNLAGLVAPRILKKCALASIGPVTSNALRQCGLETTVEADPHVIPALVSAMALCNQHL